MTDRMGALLAALDTQGFKSRQTGSGMWMFSRGGTMITYYRTPETPGEWLDLIKLLNGAGLAFPPGD
ncbi:hypothetical protein E5083_29995 [Streptomyces bauhiniae]|uniref:Uncharacterized protein n=1 Tax=Streptomyces bauhiniae TaxID=2340725 RepID=A0A4Z1CTY5_9ACTN|nr:hypothetical protein [Streptomyces bauhiniae]TGN72326.1 hypothetical protein E5083_29995 [Streptomyces bauhiniae]